MAIIQIRESGKANAQVTEPVKERIYEWFEKRGVERASQSLVCHHYCRGRYVAVTVCGDIDISAFNAAYWEAVRGDENKAVSDDTVWLHRDWIDRELFGGNNGR